MYGRFSETLSRKLYPCIESVRIRIPSSLAVLSARSVRTCLKQHKNTGVLHIRDVDCSGIFYLLNMLIHAGLRTASGRSDPAAVCTACGLRRFLSVAEYFVPQAAEEASDFVEEALS